MKTAARFRCVVGGGGCDTLIQITFILVEVISMFMQEARSCTFVLVLSTTDKQIKPAGRIFGSHHM